LGRRFILPGWSGSRRDGENLWRETGERPLRHWHQKRRTDMNISTNTIRLNWVVTLVAVALAAVAGGGPLFG